MPYLARAHQADWFRFLLRELQHRNVFLCSVDRSFHQKTLRGQGRIGKPCEWLIDNPRALTALGRILEGQEPMLKKDLAVELERMQLTQNGSLTRLGYYAYSHLRDSGLSNA